jgi:hypothetical protein
MNSVVQFPLDRVIPGRQWAGTAPAEIVIFPGVRIERASFDRQEQQALGRKRRGAAQAAVDPHTD